MAKRIKTTESENKRDKSGWKAQLKAARRNKVKRQATEGAWK